jgi:hypothetical protein
MPVDIARRIAKLTRYNISVSFMLISLNLEFIYRYTNLSVNLFETQKYVSKLTSPSPPFELKNPHSQDFMFLANMLSISIL